MNIDIREFRVKAGKRLSLAKQATRVKPFYASKADYESQLRNEVAGLAGLQNTLYADNRYALLVIFQAMDTAGKDGAIKHVFSGINPQGCQVYSFKHPSPKELEHDFLWRVFPCLPERGHIGVFNRSYYEEVLVVRVHPDRSLLGLERHLHFSGTRIVKFFLHISREEQRRRLLARIAEPEKNWKFSEGDLKARALWKDYMRAYEDCLAATSTRDAPWYVVPADDKQNARLIVARVLAETLGGLKLAYPRVSAGRRRELQAMRSQLQK